ncbi:MAG: hypothetical protein F6K19_21010 [Cyanothece sp. SIO1E1]|nr:hypothetical protein [Cyanothece sp. SIO1E1]
MTDDGKLQSRQVKGVTEHEGKFRRKFEGTSRPGPSDIKVVEGRKAQGEKVAEPGYLEKKQASLNRSKRVAWNWIIGRPSKNPDKPSLTYKVRGGKLTVTDQDGRVVKESSEAGLEKYDGVNLHGEADEKGIIKVKAGALSKGKLAEGNEYVTPREKQEAQMDKVRSATGWIVSWKDTPANIKRSLNEIKKVGFIGFHRRKNKESGAMSAIKMHQRRRAQDWSRGRRH